MAGLIPFNSRGIGFHNMLDDFFDERSLFSRNFSCDTFKIDIRDNGDSFLIDAELSGILKENVSVNVDGDVMTIAVKQDQKDEKTQDNYLHRERRFSSSSRSVRLAGAELDKISASMENGILSISIPKKDNKSTSRTISIN